MSQLTKIQSIAYSALYRFVERDHGGCEDEDCGLRKAIEDGDEDEAILIWAMSGAACDRFNRIMDRFLVDKITIGD